VKNINKRELNELHRLKKKREKNCKLPKV